MALKEQLKHFSSVDNYSSVMTKADYDSNMDILADNIDNLSNELDSDVTDLTNKINTKLDSIISIDSGSFTRFLESATITTTDSTETIITSVANLPIKCIVAIDTYSQNLQDDYATKWIFNGTIYATIKDDGTITASSSLTDVVKDDSDWAFDIAGNDGDSSGGASIDLKVTGKDSTTIKWSVFLDIKINKY